jgi:hypothetical protein
MIPRELMGLLVVVDTFLVYKIAERGYKNNRTIAFIASVLFAVMPITWILRGIYLDNLLIPLVLASILFALYTSNPSRNYANRPSINRNVIIIASISGIFLGLAIFTKIPTFVFIPLVAFLVFINTRNLKALVLWFIPVIMIPAIWPIFSIAVNEFDDWTYGVEFQSRKEGKPLVGAMEIFFEKDTLLFLLGMAGLIFAAVKRDLLVLLWVIPLFLFLYLVNWVSYFHLAPVIVIFCLAAAPPLAALFEKIARKNTTAGQLIKYVTIGSLAIFGFTGSWLLVTTNVNTGFFRLYSFIVDNLPGYSDANNTKSLLVGSYWTEIFVWVPEYIFNKDIQYVKERDLDSTPLLGSHNNSRNVIFLVDRNIGNSIEEGNKYLRKLDDDTYSVVSIDDGGLDEHDRSVYPYSSLDQNRDIGRVLVKTK